MTDDPSSGNPREQPWFGSFPVPDPEGHKHDRGHAVVLAGRRHATGAARLAAGAALRSGAGLVTVLAEPSAADIVAAHVTAVMVGVVREGRWQAALDGMAPAAVALGSGLAPNENTRAMVRAALATNAPTILDAGALTAWADDPNALFALIRERAAPTVMTPHAGEFRRLFGDIPHERATWRSGATVIAKGPETVIASPNGTARSSRHGPPWLATAGTGDVLAGLVCGLLAQGMAPAEAGEAAVWLQGEAARRLGPGMTADDLDNALRPVMGDVVLARIGAARGS